MVQKKGHHPSQGHGVEVDPRAYRNIDLNVCCEVTIIKLWK